MVGALRVLYGAGTAPDPYLVDDCFIAPAALLETIRPKRVESARGIPVLHLCLAALIAVITPNIVAIVAIAASIRRDLARTWEPIAKA